MAIRWDNIRPYNHGGANVTSWRRYVYLDLEAILNVIHQIPVIRDKNAAAERRRYEMANEFKAGENDNDNA